MNRYFILLLFTLSFLNQGCEKFGVSITPIASTPSNSTTPSRHADDHSKTAREVFKAPAQDSASQDSRMIAAKAASENLGGQLKTIRLRLADLKSAFETKTTTDQDMQVVTDRLRTLSATARSDCDLMLRVAKDLKAELPYSQASYESSAEYFRSKAKTIRTKQFQKVYIELAENFEKLADDVPRRRRLTNTFVEQLIEMQEFLAETERCLADTKVALAILSIGSKSIELSSETRYFRQHLEAFLSAVDEYQQRFYEAPPRPELKKPTESSKSPLKENKATPKTKDIDEADKKKPQSKRTPLNHLFDQLVIMLKPSKSTDLQLAGRVSQALSATNSPIATETAVPHEPPKPKQASAERVVKQAVKSHKSDWRPLSSQPATAIESKPRSATNLPKRTETAYSHDTPKPKQVNAGPALTSPVQSQQPNWRPVSSLPATPAFAPSYRTEPQRPSTIGQVITYVPMQTIPCSPPSFGMNPSAGQIITGPVHCQQIFMPPPCSQPFVIYMSQPVYGVPTWRPCR